MPMSQCCGKAATMRRDVGERSRRKPGTSVAGRPIGMRGGSASLRKTSAAPSRNTPTSQAAATTAEPMIQRHWRALPLG
jgi:hypothetical protein